MRTVQFLRAAATVIATGAAAGSFAGSAVATDPCPTCANGVTPTLKPKPKCDNRIYPLSEYHYYNRYCGPVVSPNATYGHFTTQWRPWDGGTTQTGCAVAAPTAAAPTAAAPSNTLPAPAAEAPKPATPETPGTLPKVTPPTTPVVPPAGTGKETIPAPKPTEKKGLLRRIGSLPPTSLLSPGVGFEAAKN